MKSIQNKIIVGLFIGVFINGCHTFEHQNIFLKNIKVNLNHQILEKEEGDKITIENKIEKNTFAKKVDMAPINKPERPEKVQKLSLQKSVRILKPEKFSLNTIKNWNEERLIRELGKSHFLKEEGKLKNYQYHLKECFLDVFLIKKDSGYFVNYIETRPTKLNGKIDTNSCLNEIKRMMN